MITSIFLSKESCSIHTKEPVPNSTRLTSFIEAIKLTLRLKMVEAITNSILCQWGYPKSLHRTANACLFHNPTLDKFTFLTGITTVDDHFGSLIEITDNLELLSDSWIINKLSGELLRQHREIVKRPSFPLWVILIRTLQHKKMSKGPGDLIAITFHIALFTLRSAQHFGYLLGYTRLFCYTDYHKRQVDLKLIGIMLSCLHQGRPSKNCRRRYKTALRQWISSSILSLLVGIRSIILLE